MLDLYIAAWRDTTTRLDALLRALDDDAWSRRTALPGWDVHDVVAHLAHLEAVLAGTDRSTPTGPGGATVVSDYTQSGVDARSDVAAPELVDELSAAVAARTAELTPAPTDPAGRPPRTPGDVAWDWQTLLRNRVVDTWVHELDLRDALERPGGEDAPGAHVTVHSLAAAMPFVLGRKVRPAPGTSARWILTGPVHHAVTIGLGDDGRARPVEVADPDVTLTLSSTDFVRLAAGRRGPDAVEVRVDGDADLGTRVLGAMNVLF
ncbi:MAG: maleylpyruvate isomerase family mycothiol-dependent enzyme [Aeromicrobium erythreum]